MVARKHLAWYASGMEGKALFCNQVYAEKEVDKVQKIIKDFFNTKIRYQEKETRCELLLQGQGKLALGWQNI